MKFRMSFKTPDILDVIKDIPISDMVEGIDPYDEISISDLSEEEKNDLEAAQYELKEFAEKWVEYGEYIQVEFDTETGTCTVLPSK